jgi:hypothetical protein
MQAVCEILPSAIPSLVLSLQTLKYFDQPNDYIFSKARELTKCSYEKTLTGFIMDPTSTTNSLIKSIDVSTADNLYKCEFPSADAYNWLLSLRLLTGRLESKLKAYSMILNEYNLKNKFFNTMVHADAIENLNFFLKRLASIQESGEVLFDKYFYGDLYVEFTSVYITRNVNIINERLALLNATGVPDSAAVRPFEKISQNIVQI